MSLRRLLLPVTAVILAIVAVSGMQFSGATFTSSSTYRADVSAANDWTPPTTAVTNPGTASSGTTTITATASDARSAIASVRIEYSVADANVWKPLCTATTSPYSCSWNTTSGTNAVADGSYDLRSIATDTAGYSATSDLVTTRVINTAAVVLTPLADPIKGSVTLTATYINGGATTAGTLFSFQYSTTPGVWSPISGTNACGTPTLGLNGSRTCVWDTPATNDYDVRAVATSTLGTFYDTQLSVTIDNTAPSVSLTVPSGTLSGTVVLSATASDADAGMANVLFQYRRSGTTSWTSCGTDTTDPWTCSLNTISLVDGSYDFLATATDNAGNAQPSSTLSRTINNTVSSVSVTSPSGNDVLRGAVTVTADANSTAGVRSVEIQARPQGGSTWTSLCVDSTSPYSCAWDTTPIVSATYELRAINTDNTGATTTSAIVTVTIDNQVLRGQDVQIANVATRGMAATNDTITLTYSGTVDYTSVKAGWDGTATTMSVVMSDANVKGAPLAGYDWADLSGTNLGKLSFTQNYVRAKKSATFTATMVGSTATVGGVPATVVTITLGAGTNTSNLRTATTAGTTRWYPTALVRTAGGATSSTTAAVESGALDPDF